MPVLDTFRLDGKTALVTGGTKGLGFAMARALADAAQHRALQPQRGGGRHCGAEIAAATRRRVDYHRGSTIRSHGHRVARGNQQPAQVALGARRPPADICHGRRSGDPVRYAARRASRPRRPAQPVHQRAGLRGRYAGRPCARRIKAESARVCVDQAWRSAASGRPAGAVRPAAARPAAGRPVLLRPRSVAQAASAPPPERLPAAAAGYDRPDRRRPARRVQRAALAGQRRQSRLPSRRRPSSTGWARRCSLACR